LSGKYAEALKNALIELKRQRQATPMKGL